MGNFGIFDSTILIKILFPKGVVDGERPLKAHHNSLKFSMGKLSPPFSHCVFSIAAAGGGFDQYRYLKRKR